MKPELIGAVATGWERTGVGIIRLSGEGAARCVGTVFTAADGRPLEAHPPRKLVYGALHDQEGRVIDHVLCTWSAAPHSYTGEETAELQCHGSPMVLTMALEALFARGARQAGPGEFTRRAFLNGRLDLCQAEGVMDLIEAETPAAALQAAGQLSGALSRRAEEVYQGLVDVAAHFHAVLDYPDEDLDPFTAETVKTALDQAERALKALLGTYNRGRALTRGIPTAIVGRPNVGKSSLLNAMVGYERAIVSDVPGTTRDTVEERCVLGGVTLRLMDTAGLREAGDQVERLGVERSRRAMEQAGLILVVLDRSRPMAEDEKTLIRQAVDMAPGVIVLNKSDLSAGIDLTDDMELAPIVSVSARNGDLHELEQAISDLFPQGEGGTAGDLLTNARQAEAVKRALESVCRAGEALALGVTPDALLIDVEEAMTALGEMTGRTVREDVTDRIFQRFCVGK